MSTNPSKSGSKRKIWIVVAAVVVIVVVVAGAFFLSNRSIVVPPPPSGPNVTIWDSGFCSNSGNCGYSPGTKNVTSGTGLTWTNTGGQPHTATECTQSDTTNACPNGAGSKTSSSRAFDSSTLGKGQVYTFTFTTTGTFYYYCTLHAWMHGVVVVT